MSTKVRKNYRFRKDIDNQIKLMLDVLNKDKDKKDFMTETELMENAFSYYYKQFLLKMKKIKKDEE